MAQILASGLSMGCIYALIGLGFVLIYNATQGLNFAQGEFVMSGAFIFCAMVSGGAPYIVGAVLSVIATGAMGLVFQQLFFHPLRDRHFLAFIISAIGFSIAVRNIALLVWGPNPLRVRSFFPVETVSFGGAALPPEQLFIIAVTILVLLLQYGLLFHTDVGFRLRAAAQNSEVAALMGIRVKRMVAITFIMSAMLSGVAGVLLAPIFFIDTEMGLNLIVKAFIAVTIGGFGSVPGVVLGGIVVGMIEILTAVFVSSVYKDAIIFATLILLLIVFPRGIFGERTAERV